MLSTFCLVMHSAAKLRGYGFLAVFIVEQSDMHWWETGQTGIYMWLFARRSRSAIGTLLDHACAGLARKQSERSQKAEEAAIEAGMLSRKALTQKKRRDARLASKQADRGLLEAPNFRRGTMHIRTHAARTRPGASKAHTQRRTPQGKCR